MNSGGRFGIGSGMTLGTVIGVERICSLVQTFSADGVLNKLLFFQACIKCTYKMVSCTYFKIKEKSARDYSANIDHKQKQKQSHIMDEAQLWGPNVYLFTLVEC